MKTELIETFLTLNQTKNISLCASTLYISQSSVSTRLKQLEDILGVQLFMRGKGQSQITLTQSGYDFIPIAQQYMNVQEKMSQLHLTNHKKYVTIGAVDYINNSLFTPLYKNIVTNEPQIRLNIQTHHSSELIRLVQTKELDVAYTFQQILFDDIVISPIFDDPMVVITNKENTIQSRDDLQATNEIYLHWNDSYQHWHNQYWDSNLSFIQVGTANQIFPFLEIKNSWSIVPYSMVKNNHSIRVLDIVQDAPNRTCFRVVHQYPSETKLSTIQTIDQYVQSYVDHHFN